MMIKAHVRIVLDGLYQNDGDVNEAASTKVQTRDGHDPLVSALVTALMGLDAPRLGCILAKVVAQLDELDLLGTSVVDADVEKSFADAAVALVQHWDKHDGH